eukprot:TRINITY_DN10195_c0_g1_i1.p1 TRINITY_DN10195_c0_g1~~TRINITY_DN10195_c0_g1_i1.p1  ORF type:complete len:2297 (+),score=386.81 TRINITY_DN10195_c0_g1_i1:532-6891(+)
MSTQTYFPHTPFIPSYTGSRPQSPQSPVDHCYSNDSTPGQIVPPCASPVQRHEQPQRNGDGEEHGEVYRQLMHAAVPPGGRTSPLPTSASLPGVEQSTAAASSQERSASLGSSPSARVILRNASRGQEEQNSTKPCISSEATPGASSRPCMDSASPDPDQLCELPRSSRPYKRYSAALLTDCFMEHSDNTPRPEFSSAKESTKTEVPATTPFAGFTGLDLLQSEPQLPEEQRAEARCVKTEASCPSERFSLTELLMSPQDSRDRGGRDKWVSRCLALLPERGCAKLWDAVGEVACSLAAYLATVEVAPHAVRESVRKWALQLSNTVTGRKTAEAEVVVGDRFAEGLQEAEEVAGGIPPQVEFYDPQTPEPDVWRTIGGFAEWRNLYGCLWEEEPIDDLVSDAQLWSSRHSRGAPAAHVAALFVYTAELHASVLWVHWDLPADEGLSGIWQAFNTDSLEADYQLACSSNGGSRDVDFFRVGSSAARRLGTHNRKGFTRHAMSCPKLGIKVFSAPRSGSRGVPRWLVRYVNLHRGGNLSPLHDTGLWLSEPDHAFTESSPYSIAHLPPPGVLEYLLSRENGEKLERDQWAAEPVVSAPVTHVVAMCEARANQQKYDKELCAVAFRTVRSSKEVAHDSRRGTRQQGSPDGSSLGQPDNAEQQVFQLEISASPELSGNTAARLREYSFGESHLQASGSGAIDTMSFPVTEAYSAGVQHAVRRVFDKKIHVNDGVTRPTPLELGHALTQQIIKCNGREWVAALSAGSDEPRVISDVNEEEAVTLAQLNRPLPDQPFFHLNHAMRALQFQRTAPSVELCPRVTGPVEHGSYLAQRGTWEHRDPQQAVFKRRAATMVLLTSSPGEQKWFCRPVEGGVAVAIARQAVSVSLNTWLLPAVRPLMQLLDCALSRLSERSVDVAVPVVPARRHGAGHPRRRSTVNFSFPLSPRARPGRVDDVQDSPAPRLKNYRGICGVKLPPNVYAEGGIVRWGAYTSASEDQGVASSFALGEGDASVFTIQGRTCHHIAPWSRFARERECIYRPNTLFHIVHCLSTEQQQILGKERLQLFELREIAEQEASCIMVLRMLSRVRSRGAANVIFQVVEAMRQDGVLDISLASSRDGQVAPSWWYQVRAPEGQESSPIAPSAEWKQAHDPLAAACLIEAVDGICPVPRRIDVAVPPRAGSDTSFLDEYRKGFHCGDEDYILETRLQMFGDAGGGEGPRRVPAAGGTVGWQLIHHVGSVLGSVRWAPETKVQHSWSSCHHDCIACSARMSSLGTPAGFRSPTPDWLPRTRTGGASQPELLRTTHRRSLPPAAGRTSSTAEIAAGPPGTRSQPTEEAEDLPRRHRNRPAGLRNPELASQQQQPQWARLDADDGWRPEDTDTEPWFQIACPARTLVGGVLLKGMADRPMWVASFSVMHSEDGEYWTALQGGRLFSGCSSNDEPRGAFFHPPVLARAIRICPQTWVGAPGLRAALLTESWSHLRPHDAFVCGPAEQDIELGLISRVVVHLRGTNPSGASLQSPSRDDMHVPMSTLAPLSANRGRTVERLTDLSSPTFLRQPSACGSIGSPISTRLAGEWPNRAASSWALAVEVCFRSGRRGMAIGIEGAATLATVLQLGVPLRQVAARNHQVGCLGLALILEALRRNRFVTSVDVDDDVLLGRASKELDTSTIGTMRSSDSPMHTFNTNTDATLLVPSSTLGPAPSLRRGNTPPSPRTPSGLRAKRLVPTSPQPTLPCSPAQYKGVSAPTSADTSLSGPPSKDELSHRHVLPHSVHRPRPSRRPRGWPLLRTLVGPGNMKLWAVLRAALVVRCSLNRGSVPAQQLLSVPHGKWPAAVVAALWDEREVLSQLPLASVVQNMPQLEDLLLGLLLECRARGAPHSRLLLHTACSFGHVALTSQLLDAGIRPDEEDTQGRCALHCAARHVAFDSAEGTLLESVVCSTLRQLACPAALNAADRRTGRTALHVAVYFHRMAVVRHLLRLGAHYNRGDLSGATALGLATSLGYSDIAQELHNFGASEEYGDRGPGVMTPPLGKPAPRISEQVHVDHVTARAVCLFFRARVLVADCCALDKNVDFIDSSAFARESTVLKTLVRSARVLGTLWLAVAQRRRARHRSQNKSPALA